MSLPRLHVITDDVILRDRAFCERAEAVLARCGADVALHLRGHGTPGRVLYDLGARLAAATLRTGAWLFVNDRVDIALAVRARGVQLGTHSMPIADARALLGPGARIGYSAHAAREAGRAAADGADFVIVGTIYDSATHPGRAPGGITLIVQSAASTSVPVLAIGGVTRACVTELVAAGAYGVAVISGVWGADDAPEAAAAYVAALRAESGAASSH
jgi:thiamine-phosphate diphosphorylase